MQYIPSFFEKLKYSLKRFNIYLVEKPPPKLKNIICAKFDPISFENYSGVYEIPFIREDGTKNYYIGMTSRKFKYRKKGHIADIKYNRKNTALASFYEEETIQVNFNKSKIIFPSSLYYPSLIRETIEIVTRKNSICNDAALFHLPKIWLELLNEYENKIK